MTAGYADKPVLDIPSLSICKGQITTLFGTNGAGKTTLLNLLAFLSEPVTGDVIYSGKKVAGKQHNLTLRRKVGLIAQNPLLLRGSVLENVIRGLRFRGVKRSDRKRLAERALDQVGITQLLDRPCRSLSGGEAQKVALARTLALGPEVLLLDEPFTHLDQQSTEQICRVLTDCCRQQGMTVILTTHEYQFGIALADHVISLVAGRPVHAPLLNLYRGRVSQGSFDTGKINIVLPEDIVSGSYILIDPQELVLSLEPLQSSMRNSFQGRVVAIAEQHGREWVTVEAGERFHVQITRQSLDDLAVTLGSRIRVNFKSTAVKVF